MRNQQPESRPVPRFGLSLAVWFVCSSWLGMKAQIDEPFWGAPIYGQGLIFVGGGASLIVIGVGLAGWLVAQILNARRSPWTLLFLLLVVSGCYSAWGAMDEWLGDRVAFHRSLAERVD